MIESSVNFQRILRAVMLTYCLANLVSLHVPLTMQDGYYVVMISQCVPNYATPGGADLALKIRICYYVSIWYRLYRTIKYRFTGLHKKEFDGISHGISRSSKLRIDLNCIIVLNKLIVGCFVFSFLSSSRGRGYTIYKLQQISRCTVVSMSVWWW